MTDQHEATLYDAVIALQLSNNALERLAKEQNAAGFAHLAEHTRKQIARNREAAEKLKAVVAEEREVSAV